MEKNQKKAYIFALSAISLWSTVATAFKLSLNGMNFIQLLFFASLTSTVILSIIIIKQNKFKNLLLSTKNEILKSAFVGFLNPFLYYFILLKAYSLLPAQIAQPLNYTWPIVLVLLSAPLLKQKLHLRSFIALIISFFGVFIIASKGNINNIQIDDSLGIILATSSSIIWSLFWIFNMKDTRDETVKLFLNFLFGAVYSFIAVLLFSNFKIENTYSLISSIYVGIFEMGITFVLWLTALQYTTSNASISNLVYISPFLSLIFIHFILGESIFPTTILGLALIIAGILVQQLKNKL